MSRPLFSLPAASGIDVGSMLKIQPSLGGPSEYRSYLLVVAFSGSGDKNAGGHVLSRFRRGDWLVTLAGCIWPQPRNGGFGGKNIDFCGLRS